MHLFQHVGCVRNKHQFHSINVGRYPRNCFMGFDRCNSWKHESEPKRTGRPVVEQTWSLFNTSHDLQTQAISESDQWIWTTLFFPSNVQSSHQEALLNVFEDNEAVIKMIIKGRNPTMRHVSTTHRVVFWLVIRSNQIWTLKIQIQHIDTKKRNSKTYWPREITHEMNGIIFCVEHWPFQFYRLLEWCRKERKKIQVKKESQQSRSRWWRKDSWCVSFCCVRKPCENAEPSLVCSTSATSVPLTAVEKNKKMRDRAFRSNVGLEGGSGSSLRHCEGMGFSGNEGRVKILSKTRQTATICLKWSQASWFGHRLRSSLALERYAVLQEG